MNDQEELIFSTIIVAMALFHLVYGFRNGKILMEAGGPITRADSPIFYWILMIAGALVLVTGLYIGFIGIPDREVL